MTFVVIVAFLSFLLLSYGAAAAQTLDVWEVDPKDTFEGQTISLKKLEHPSNTLHTCYEAVCVNQNGQCDTKYDNTTIGGNRSISKIHFCYPAIMVSGLGKCGTSAMYLLLSHLPGSMKLFKKENCPFRPKGPSLWQYFLSMPSINSVTENSVIYSGCLDAPLNMRMRQLLRNPTVYYIVMVRDYADMLWSAYNFFCSLPYDMHNCTGARWADAKHHTRSPETFHELVTTDIVGQLNNQSQHPFRESMKRPCIGAEKYYSGYIERNFHGGNVSKRNIFVIANEQLEQNPLEILTRIATTVGINITTLNAKKVEEFSKTRVNVQDFKGVGTAVSMENYSPGLYKISKYQPMLAETRQLLNKCWHNDCVRIVNITKHNYAACANV